MILSLCFIVLDSIRWRITYFRSYHPYRICYHNENDYFKTNFWCIFYCSFSNWYIENQRRISIRKTSFDLYGSRNESKQRNQRCIWSKNIVYEYSIIFNLILLFKDFYKFNIHSMINPLFCYTIKGIKALRLAG